MGRDYQLWKQKINSCWKSLSTYDDLEPYHDSIWRDWEILWFDNEKAINDFKDDHFDAVEGGQKLDIQESKKMVHQNWDSLVAVFGML